MNEESKKISKITIILIVLIALSIAYLAYAVNRSSTVNNDNETETPSSAKEAVNTNSASESTVDSTSTAYTKDQVALKNKASDCWTIINGNVYDITSYVPNHPGGEEEIVKICGKDGSQLFAKPMEHKEGGADNVLSGFKIGTLQQ